MNGYPADRVTLREVGLRDGLQISRGFPPTERKIEWLRKEHASGVRTFELGSFLPAARFPQFADLSALIEASKALPGARSAALALNERGLEDALASGVDEIVCVVSATEEHSRANARRSRDEAVALVARADAMRKAAGGAAALNAGIAMSFGCSIAGAVDPDEVLRLAGRLYEAGADVVGVADTVGYAGPRQVAALSAGMAKLAGGAPFIVHLHDTRGAGIANAAAALDAGCRVLDGALAGLGGCPFAPGATGNVAFEDLVFLCERMGFPTGIDLDALRPLRQIIAETMPEEPLYGAVGRAGPPGNMEWRA